MNWYKYLKFSSRNIKLPKEIEKQINDITNISVKYYFSNQKKKNIAGIIYFTNPYTKQQDNIPVVLHPLTSGFENTIANFNPQERIINIFPYHHKIQDVNFSKLFNYIKENLYHEITHSIDPKFLIKDWWRNRKNVDYLLREEEFDAYSKQIEYIVQNNINKTNIENLKTWLRTNNIESMPDYLQNYKNIIQYWQTNKPIYIKKLKQRIYNSFIGELNNDI